MYKFYFPLGDPSGDGHSECINYLLESNKTVDELQDIYGHICTKLNYGLDTQWEDAPCGDYEDSSITQQQLNKLCVDASSFINDINNGISHDEFVMLFINFITQNYPGVEINMLTDDIPKFGEKLYLNQRHIGCFGYGLFE